MRKSAISDERVTALGHVCETRRHGTLGLMAENNALVQRMNGRMLRMREVT